MIYTVKMHLEDTFLAQMTRRKVNQSTWAVVGTKGKKMLNKEHELSIVWRNSEREGEEKNKIS